KIRVRRIPLAATVECAAVINDSRPTWIPAHSTDPIEHATPISLIIACFSTGNTHTAAAGLLPEGVIKTVVCTYSIGIAVKYAGTGVRSGKAHRSNACCCSERAFEH